jgi:hypothetical protein
MLIANSSLLNKLALSVTSTRFLGTTAEMTGGAIYISNNIWLVNSSSIKG